MSEAPKAGLKQQKIARKAKKTLEIVDNSYKLHLNFFSEAELKIKHNAHTFCLTFLSLLSLISFLPRDISV